MDKKANKIEGGINRLRELGITLVEKQVKMDSGLYDESRLVTESDTQLAPAISQWVKDNKLDVLAYLNTQRQFALIREVLSTPISDLGEIPLEQALVIGQLEEQVLIRLNEQQEWVATDSGKWFLTAKEEQGLTGDGSLWESYGEKQMYSLSQWLIASCQASLSCLENTLWSMLARREVIYRLDSQTGLWIPVWHKYEAMREAA